MVLKSSILACLFATVVITQALPIGSITSHNDKRLFPDGDDGDGQLYHLEQATGSNAMSQQGTDGPVAANDAGSKSTAKTLGELGNILGRILGTPNTRNTADPANIASPHGALPPGPFPPGGAPRPNGTQ